MGEGGNGGRDVAQAWTKAGQPWARICLAKVAANLPMVVVVRGAGRGTIMGPGRATVESGAGAGGHGSREQGGGLIRWPQDLIGEGPARGSGGEGDYVCK